MRMNCPPLLLPPPPVRSIDSHRLLISSARRRETAAVRERWKQNQKTMTSRVRVHPLSAPPNLSSSARSVKSALRKSVSYGRRQDDVNTSTSNEKRLQFSFLEREVTKSNVTKRLPYFVPVHVQCAPERDYPTQSTSYRDVFFRSATGAAPKDGTPRCKSARKERFFIHPEWASEDVSWKRFQHRSNPDHFRYSWM